MKKNYGLPYQGSKNKLAEDIINFLPKKKVLVDLFGGGGANINVNNRTFDYGPNFGLQGEVGIGGYIK